MTNPPSRRSNRARWLRLFIKCGCGLLLLVCGAYGAIAYRYFSQTPRLTRNFAAELNSPILKIPEAERAWPLYRLALEKLNRRLPSETYVSDEYLECRDRKRFRAEARFSQNRQVLPLISAAAARSKMGLPLRDQWTAEDLPWLKKVYVGSEHTLRPVSKNPELMAVLVPPPDCMQLLVEMLCFDAEEAVSQGDGVRVANGFSAVIAIAGHLREVPLLINAAASWRALRLAMSTLRWVLVEEPDLIDEDGLALLAAKLTKYSHDAPISPQLASERMMFEDVVQRLYADNGDGDGRLLAHDTQFAVDGVVCTPANMLFRDAWTTKLVAPIESWRSSGRREIMRRYNRFMDETEAACAAPLWRRLSFPQPPDLGLPKQASEEFRRLLILNYSAVYSLSQATSQEFNATLVAIELARYRLQHGRWPATLAEAPLDGAPVATVDFHTGGRLQYRLVEDRPLLYSLGADKDDDGGRSEISSGDAESPRHRTGGKVGDGDWILLPAAKPDAYEQLSEVF